MVAEAAPAALDGDHLPAVRVAVPAADAGRDTDQHGHDHFAGAQEATRGAARTDGQLGVQRPRQVPHRAAHLAGGAADPQLGFRRHLLLPAAHAAGRTTGSRKNHFFLRK